jgi:Penicillinase repressor
MIPNQKKKGAAKVKIEFTDSTGAKYSFAIEGRPSKENMSKVIDFVETMSGDLPIQEHEQTPIDTNFARVYELIENKFKFGSFNSGDVLEAYQDEFQLTTTLSTISTYLARLAERELLTRSRNGAGWIYRLTRQEQPAGELPVEGPPANYIPR